MAYLRPVHCPNANRLLSENIWEIRKVGVEWAFHVLHLMTSESYKYNNLENQF